MKKQIGVTVEKTTEGNTIFSGIYGLELLLDCWGCNVTKFNKKSIIFYFENLIRLIKMEAGREPLFFQEQNGLGAIQFILTSQIAVHCVDKIGTIFIDIFSCKDFNTGIAKQFTQEWFEVDSIGEHIIYRG